jgi:carbamate kinase
MGPKVDAAMRFVRSGGRRSIITSLDQITDAVDHGIGTVIENPTPPNDFER